LVHHPGGSARSRLIVDPHQSELLGKSAFSSAVRDEIFCRDRAAFAPKQDVRRPLITQFRSENIAVPTQFTHRFYPIAGAFDALPIAISAITRSVAASALIPPQLHAL
jgi:hypothetical protein